MVVITASCSLVAFAAGCRSYRGAPANAAGAATSEAPARPSGVGTRASFVLANGLRLMLEENHAAPVVAVQAWVATGAADDPAGQEGVAHVV